MAKIKPIYLIGAAALAAYLFKDKLFGKGAASKEVSDTEVDLSEASKEKPDVVIDTTKTGDTVKQAVETAKTISEGVKDIKVLIKTPAGTKDVQITKGKKKPKRKKRRSKKKPSGFDAAKWATNPLNPLSAIKL